MGLLPGLTMYALGWGGVAYQIRVLPGGVKTGSKNGRGWIDLTNTRLGDQMGS